MQSPIKNVTADIFPEDVERSLASLEEKLNENYPGGVPRNKIDIATGYILHPRTCANEDALGIGIKGRFKVGRNIIYPIRGTMAKVRSKVRV